MAFAPDGRLFITEQGGTLRVIKNGVLLPSPFLTVSVDSRGERGLLGIAFDPDFSNNNYMYVYYTATIPVAHNRISRFTANGDVALQGSEVVILELNNLSGATNHNGGALHFGKDGKLYAAVGENANGSNAQTLSNLLGKLLRINADGTIPTNNPFYNSASGNNRAIWALGLRNPFTFAVQPGTGRIFINDVGQNAWEEINEGVASANYGWPGTEGYTTDPRYQSPLYAYGHGTGNTVGCAITGGTFYNPATVRFPSEYLGTYFFADFCSSWIRRYDPVSNTVSDFATGANAPVDLQVSSNGDLYYLAQATNSVYKVVYTGSGAPSISKHPSSQTVSVGQPATFTVSASGATPFTYQWQMNGVNISGATSSSYTIGAVAIADDGAQFRCIVSNSLGSATSNSATLTVTTNTATCTFRLSATIANVASGSSTTSVNVTTAGGCAWTATSNTGFISVTGGSTGNGNGTVNLNIAANPGAQRTGTVIIAGQTFTVTQAASGSSTSGLYDPINSIFYLKNSNSAGAADFTASYGPGAQGWIPVVGDWNGDGTDTLGLYNTATSTFFLKNSNASGAANMVFSYGPSGAGWLPIAGDWDGDGDDTVGLYNPATSMFFLKYSNAAGAADLVFAFGPAGAGWMPLAGDWNGDGVDTIGLYNRGSSMFFLMNANTAGAADMTFMYGPAAAGWQPIVGDWNHDGSDSVGLYDPTSGTFFLKNMNTVGAADTIFGFGPANEGWEPLAGDWMGM